MRDTLATLRKKLHKHFMKILMTSRALNPLVHAAMGTVNSTSGCKHKELMEIHRTPHTHLIDETSHDFSTGASSVSSTTAGGTSSAFSTSAPDTEGSASFNTVGFVFLGSGRVAASNKLASGSTRT